ncbi:MAG: isopenicillin N synthase family oxygenase [Actinobacteria bacterium]|nr:isopenicillin N synthase family oxygenase [Actinomycetota bacterium]
MPENSAPAGPPIPVVDLAPWRDGTPDGRAAVAGALDAALRRSGFVLVTGHGVPLELTADVRAVARRFFALPDDVKRRYAAGVDGRGWLPPGVEANGYSEGTPTPPDLKESLSYGADAPTGDAALDARWFQPNPWPAEMPDVERLFAAYGTVMRALADDLLAVAAVALGLPEDFFVPHTRHPTYTFNANHYPPMTVVGEPAEGQFRIGPHTDFGTFTLLDREPGAGGLQVFTTDGEWVDAPYVPGALTVNVGDLLCRWTGDRWLSARHRVLPPQPHAAEEDLVSLVWFAECDPGAVVESVPPPVGVRVHEPVVAADYLEDKYRAISVG